MSKPEDGLVRVKITGTMIPSFRPGVGTELNHSKWIYRAGIGVAVAIGPGPDHWIDLVDDLQISGVAGSMRHGRGPWARSRDH